MRNGFGMEFTSLTRILVGWLFAFCSAASIGETVPTLPLQIKILVTTEDPQVTEDKFLQGKLELTTTVTTEGKYSARAIFTGCTPDSTGRCRAKILYFLLNPNGDMRFSSRWLKLWYEKPPQATGKWTLAEEMMSGGVSPELPGTWEVFAIARDEVTGQTTTQSAQIVVQPMLLPVSKSSSAFCNATEVVLFLCRSRAKTISICADPDVLRGTGHLSYRFGVAGKPPELEYPLPNIAPKAAFRFYTSEYAKGNTQQLQFEYGGAVYTVFHEQHAFEWSGAGVQVTQGNRRIAYFPCDKELATPNLIQLQYLGLPKAEFLEDEPLSTGYLK